MDKTLYLHIGHYKTGTTALQVCLHRARDVFATHGIDYPTTRLHHAKHSAYAFSVLRAAGVKKLMYEYRDPTPPAKIWGDLYAHITKSTARVTVISSEEFMRIGQFPKAQEILGRVLSRRPEGLRVKAIVYLRDPDAHVKSWYNQLVKMGLCVSDFNSALEHEIEEIHINYRRALEPWHTLLGPENLEIRPYLRDPDDPDALMRDFASVLGGPLPEDLPQLKSDPNPRIDDRLVDLVRLMQNMDFPPATIKAIRAQAQHYLQMQDDQAKGGADGMPPAQARARAGLDWLARQDTTLPVADFAARMPEPLPTEQVDRNLLLGFVFSELIQLRQRVNNAALPDLAKRLDALETRPAKLEAKS